MRVAIVGATGVLGRPVMAHLLERGHEVVAIVRDPAAVSASAHARCTVVRGDILVPETLEAGVEGSDAVLHLATAIPKAGVSSDWTLNDRIRREGTVNLVKAVARRGRARYIQQSVAMLHAGDRNLVADEDSPLRPSPVLESALDMEQAVRDSGLRWVILRGGAFYGPNTGRMHDLNRLAREGRLIIPGDGGDYVSLIHVQDMAEAVVLAVERASAELTLNIVDDRPVTYRELFDFVAEANGGPAPEAGGPPLLRNFRVSNARARRALGWAPSFSDYRVGWAAE